MHSSERGIMLLRQRVDAWASKLKVTPRLVRVQRMTRKWGSCSTAGTITLAIDLDDESEGFQDFVIVHELLHLKVPNHGRLFKALMTVHMPRWREFEAGRRLARSISPAICAWPNEGKFAYGARGRGKQVRGVGRSD
jgi:predicted metal-dependent hydrolase